jgi:hypothetical protein
MRLNNAATVLRAAGLEVVEVAGWKGRDNGTEFADIRGLTVHHTAGSRTSSVSGELNVLINGRPGLSGPISQFMVSREGVWYCVADGPANHNKTGFAGPNKGYGNRSLIGVECQHSGGDEPWRPVQYNSVVKGVAALAKAYGFDEKTVAGHKEHQPGEKVDPTFSMGKFRTDVDLAMRAPAPPPRKVEWMKFEVSMPVLREGDDDAKMDGYNRITRIQRQLQIDDDGIWGPQTSKALGAKEMTEQKWRELFGLGG